MRPNRGLWRSALRRTAPRRGPARRLPSPANRRPGRPEGTPPGPRPPKKGSRSAGRRALPFCVLQIHAPLFHGCFFFGFGRHTDLPGEGKWAPFDRWADGQSGPRRAGSPRWSSRRHNRDRTTTVASPGISRNRKTLQGAMGNIAGAHPEEACCVRKKRIAGRWKAESAGPPGGPGPLRGRRPAPGRRRERRPAPFPRLVSFGDLVGASTRRCPLPGPSDAEGPAARVIRALSRRVPPEVGWSGTMGFTSAQLNLGGTGSVNLLAVPRSAHEGPRRRARRCGRPPPREMIAGGAPQPGRLPQPPLGKVPASGWPTGTGRGSGDRIGEGNHGPAASTPGVGRSRTPKTSRRAVPGAPARAPDTGSPSSQVRPTKAGGPSLRNAPTSGRLPRLKGPFQGGKDRHRAPESVRGAGAKIKKPVSTRPGPWGRPTHAIWVRPRPGSCPTCSSFLEFLSKQRKRFRGWAGPVLQFGRGAGPIGKVRALIPSGPLRPEPLPASPHEGTSPQFPRCSA